LGENDTKNGLTPSELSPTMGSFAGRIRRIKIYRRAATRYENLAAHAPAFVTIAAVLDWLNHEV
jgi:hypothetical protein